MSFVPHTELDVAAMLDAVGAATIDDLYDEIPTQLVSGSLDGLPEAIGEMALMRLMAERARADEVSLCFLGAGAYDHHIPAAVWDLVSRGEFLTAYTPYQAEASQGTLQVIYEFQTMMANLTAMDVSNASVYDGATALAEAVFMAVRANRKSRSRRVLLAGAVNPLYRDACHAIVVNQQVELVQVDIDERTGLVDGASLEAHAEDDLTAVVLSLPNFFGGVDDVNRLTDWAHARGALVIAVVNPVALAVLRPPGHWGSEGADIAVGEGQPLGIPLASGGPYFGFMCAKEKLVRQLPGRIIGRTVDSKGREGFALTLQAREQHIRRAKATSNICTNQGLLVTAATIYLSLMGEAGLKRVASLCHHRSNQLRTALCGIEGISARFEGPTFHEFVAQLTVPAASVVEALQKDGILPGLDLGVFYPSLANCLLINVTETKSEDDLATLTNALGRALAARGRA